jgi:hypothetical protein
MDAADLSVALTISIQPLFDCWIYNYEFNQKRRKFVLAGVLIVNGPTRSTQTMTQGYTV